MLLFLRRSHNSIHTSEENVHCKLLFFHQHQYDLRQGLGNNRHPFAKTMHILLRLRQQSLPLQYKMLQPNQSKKDTQTISQSLNPHGNTIQHTARNQRLPLGICRHHSACILRPLLHIQDTRSAILAATRHDQSHGRQAPIQAYTHRQSRKRYRSCKRRTKEDRLVPSLRRLPLQPSGDGQSGRCGVSHIHRRSWSCLLDVGDGTLRRCHCLCRGHTLPTLQEARRRLLLRRSSLLHATGTTPQVDGGALRHPHHHNLRHGQPSRPEQHTLRRTLRLPLHRPPVDRPGTHSRHAHHHLWRHQTHITLLQHRGSLHGHRLCRTRHCHHHHKHTGDTSHAITHSPRSLRPRFSSRRSCWHSSDTRSQARTLQQ